MNKISIILLTLLCFQFVSCEKGDNIQQNSLQKEAINPSELTRLVSEYEVSQEHDAITFFVGRAFEEILSQDRSIKKQLLSNLKIGQYNSLNAFLDKVPNGKDKMNKRISILLKEENAYKNWQNQVLESNEDENYLSLFNSKAHSHNLGEEFIVYIPDEVKFDENNTQIAIGADITLPNKDQGLIFYENKAVTITLEEAQKLDKNLVFVGVNQSSSNVLSKINERRDVYPKLSKWYHHGKIEWQSCTSQCDVDYEWHTCYRWYSGWRFKEGGTLTTSGDVSEFYYSEYRIKIQVLFFGLSNFGIYEKHWDGDNWKTVNY